MNKKFFSIMYVAVALTAAVSLGACSTKKSSLPDEGSKMAGQADVTDLTDEEREQLGARDPGFADTSALEDVRFDFDRSDLRSDARDILNRNAEWIMANPNVKVQIEGHCDERGTEEYNLALGERRANSVKNFFISLGIDGERLYTISYGEELPIDPQHSESAWAKNRRAHFLVTQ